MFPSLVPDDRRKGRIGGLIFESFTVSHRGTRLAINRKLQAEANKEAELKVKKNQENE